MSHLKLQWNPDFLNPHFFKPCDSPNQILFTSPRLNTLNLSLISQTTPVPDFSKQIFVSLGGSKKSMFCVSQT